MRPNRWWIAVVVVGILAATVAWAGGPRPARLGTETTGDAALAASVREQAGDATGYRDLAVAVVDDGQVRFAGLSDGSEPSPDTAFEIGSVGKAMTGMLLADLIADGTVLADEPLGELLPGVAFQDPALAETSLAELASHRSGLPSVRITSVGQALATSLRNLRGQDPYAGQDSARFDVHDGHCEGGLR